MMDMLGVRGPDLGHLDPLPFGKAGGHNFIGIFHIAVERNLDRLRHGQNHIG
jgi:hypothetical protein